MANLLESNKDFIEKYWDWDANQRHPNSIKVGIGWVQMLFKCPDCGKEYVYYDTRKVAKMKELPCKRRTNKTHKELGLKRGKLLKDANPEFIEKYWDNEENSKNGVFKDKLTYGSWTKVVLRCEVCGFKWVRDAPRLIEARNCPCCAGKVIVTGVNDLQSKHKDLVSKYWDFERNSSIGIYPDKVLSTSHKKVFLICPDCGKSFKRSLLEFTTVKKLCPHCKEENRPKINFQSESTEALVELWDFEKNNKEGITLSNSSLSGTKVNLKCNKCGYSWGDYTIGDVIYYHLGCPVCAGHRVKKGYNDLKSNFLEVALDWNYDKNDLNPEDVTSGSNRKVWWKCHVCGCEWQAIIEDRTRKDGPIGCPQCAVNNRPLVSNCEIEVADFIKSFYKGIVETSKRGLLSYNRELDIYIPEKRIAFEYNGIYWHSELQKDSKAHWNKMKECEKRGIKLFYIWEDVWRDKKDIVKQLIKSKLGCYNGDKINARDCVIKEITKDIANKFIDENHIQGRVGSTKYIGLLTQEMKLVAVCQFLIMDKSQNNWVLTRYATNSMVRGGFTKLLKYFERKYKPSRLVTFSDNDISDGNLYKINGFFMEEELIEDYYYVDSSFSKRIHKFCYRKDRFKRDPNLVYKEGLTERQLAKLNELYRVYDSGKKRWVKIYK